MANSPDGRVSASAGPDCRASRRLPGHSAPLFLAHPKGPILLIDFLDRHRERIPAASAEAVLGEPTDARRIERLIGERRKLGLALYMKS